MCHLYRADRGKGDLDPCILESRYFKASLARCFELTKAFDSWMVPDTLFLCRQLLSVLPCLAMLDRPSLQDVAAAAELQRFGAGEAVVWQVRYQQSCHEPDADCLLSPNWHQLRFDRSSWSIPVESRPCTRRSALTAIKHPLLCKIQCSAIVAIAGIRSRIFDHKSWYIWTFECSKDAKEGAVFDRCTPLVQGAPVENLLVVLRGSLAAWQEGAADPLFHLKEGTACPHRLGAGKRPVQANTSTSISPRNSCII